MTLTTENYAQLARVTEFMDVPPEGILSPSGRFKLARFEVTEQDATVQLLRAQLQGAKHGGVGAHRAVPQGTYTALYRATSDDPFCKWEPVMSDTPNEIEDHLDPIFFAGGRVLVHGLGLGCIVAALIQKPEVQHIDVVEVDEDVIALTGSYYADHPKVTIHHADCSTYKWPVGTRWNYVWHDIWTCISGDNLSDRENAEFGITYEMMHRKFASRCDMQASWAYGQAHSLRKRTISEERMAEEFVETWKRISLDERLYILLRTQCTSGLGGGVPVEDDRAFWQEAKRSQGGHFLPRGDV